ncbi:BCCT transporter family protein, partial [Vibrio parahaemolyticus AQ3810]
VWLRPACHLPLFYC